MNVNPKSRTVKESVWAWENAECWYLHQLFAFASSSCLSSVPACSFPICHYTHLSAWGPETISMMELLGNIPWILWWQRFFLERFRIAGTKNHIRQCHPTTGTAEMAKHFEGKGLWERGRAARAKESAQDEHAWSRGVLHGDFQWCTQTRGDTAPWGTVCSMCLSETAAQGLGTKNWLCLWTPKGCQLPHAAKIRNLWFIS